MNDPILIGNRLELFVDDLLVDQMHGVEFRSHPPVPAPPVDNPPAGAYMTVIHADGRYRAYCRQALASYTGERFDGNPGEYTAYFDSEDGILWNQPALNIYPATGGTPQNAVLADMPPFSHNFSPFYDARPGVPATERFKALSGVATHEFAKVGQTHPHMADWQGGLYAFVSADGIHWQRVADTPVIVATEETGYSFDSQNVAFWSTAENCYVCYFRSRVTPHGKLRTISRTTSDDFHNWTPAVQMNPNLPGEHLYTSQTHPYFRAPHIYIALPTRYQPERGSSTDILFMAARAGSNQFSRLFKDAFIRPGPNPANWGNRSNYAALNVVPTGPAEMSIYHCKTGQRYTLRSDGFVSIHASDTTGEWLSHPIQFDGSKLVVNASTSAGGSITVEIQDATGTPIPGFEMERCVPVIGDAIELPVNWQDQPSLEKLAATPVRLRFKMTEADLFAMQFTTEQSSKGGSVPRSVTRKPIEKC